MMESWEEKFSKQKQLLLFSGHLTFMTVAKISVFSLLSRIGISRILFLFHIFSTNGTSSKIDDKILRKDAFLHMDHENLQLELFSMWQIKKSIITFRKR